MPLALIVIGGVFGVLDIGIPPLLILGIIMIVIGFYMQAKRNRERREAHGQY
jgi:membrane-bound ClpP family serine protease